MNSREKLLLGIVGAALVFLAGNTMRKGYFGAIEALKQERSSKEKKLADLTRAEGKLVKDSAAWRDVGAQTLSMNPNEAVTLLRNELYALADKAGLQQKVDITVGVPATGGLKEGGRVLGASLQGTGPVEQVRALLFEMHRTPYLLRIRELTLEPKLEQTGKSRTDREFRGQITFRVKVETLLLPETKVVPKITPAKLKPEERKPVERTLLALADQYDKLARTWFEPPRAVVVTPPQGPVPPPPPPPPPGAAQNPNPAPGATNIPISTQLRWTPGHLATKHRIYFGTTNPPPLEGEQPGVILVKDNLEFSTTYYWRIDEISYKTPEEPPASQPAEAAASAPAMAEAPATQPAGATQPAMTEGTATQPAVAIAPAKKPEPVEVVIPGQLWTFTTMPEPPPPDADLQLVSVLSSPRGQQVVLRNPTNPNAPDVRVEVGDVLYGGTLVFVHPRGAVSEKRGTRRFHPVGETLKTGRVLTANDDPVIYDALMKLQARLAGISEQPG